MATPRVMRNTVPEIERQVEIRCKQLSQRGVIWLERFIEDALENPAKYDPRIVMMAIKEVMDRGMGRAKQQVDQNINVNGGESLIEAIQQAKTRVIESIADKIKIPESKTH